MTEKELVAIISATMYRSGSTAGTKPLFVNCVSGRARYPLVDSPASDNVIGDGDIVFVDGGGASDGYVSDILRLIGVGRAARRRTGGTPRWPPRRPRRWSTRCGPASGSRELIDAAAARRRGGRRDRSGRRDRRATASASNCGSGR